MPLHAPALFQPTTIQTLGITKFCQKKNVRLLGAEFSCQVAYINHLLIASLDKMSTLRVR